MKCVTIQPHIKIQGEYGENQSIQLNEFTHSSVFNGLWRGRGSKDQRVLFTTHRGSKSKGRNVQEVGEAQ